MANGWTHTRQAATFVTLEFLISRLLISTSFWNVEMYPHVLPNKFGNRDTRVLTWEGFHLSAVNWISLVSRHRWGFIYFNSVACQNSTSRHLGPSLTNHESCHGSGRNAGIKQHSACPQARFWQDHFFLRLVDFFSILRLRPVTVCIRSGWPIFNLNWIYALQVPQLEVFFPDSSRLLPSRALEPNLFQVFFFELNHIYF